MPASPTECRLPRPGPLPQSRGTTSPANAATDNEAPGASLSSSGSGYPGQGLVDSKFLESIPVISLKEEAAGVAKQPWAGVPRPPEAMLPLVAIESLPRKIRMSATSRKQIFNLSNFEDMWTEINFSGEVWTRLKRRRAARNRGFRNIFRSRKDIRRRALLPSISYFSCTIRWFAANLRPEGSPVFQPRSFSIFSQRRA